MQSPHMLFYKLVNNKVVTSNGSSNEIAHLPIIGGYGIGRFVKGQIICQTTNYLSNDRFLGPTKAAEVPLQSGFGSWHQLFLIDFDSV